MDPLSTLILHVAATWALLGVIWIVQLVQYPAFARVGPAEFRAYHEAHCNRIHWIVAPLMGVELLTGIALVVDPPAGVSGAILGAGLALIALNWALTGLVSVPLHGRLGAGLRSGAQERLVATNWLRTAAWSARAGLVTVALQAVLEAQA